MPYIGYKLDHFLFSYTEERSQGMFKDASSIKPIHCRKSTDIDLVEQRVPTIRDSLVLKNAELNLPPKQ